MTTYFAIADLHGRFDLLEKAIDAAAKYAENKGLDADECKLITLGDYIDRGKQSRQIIEWLMEGQSDYEGVVCLKGNHEDMAVQTLTGQVQDQSWWVGNGGGATLESYGAQPVLGMHCDRTYPLSVVPEEHVKWMASLPIFYETEKQVFVHAGIPADDLDLKDQEAEDMMWMLYAKDDDGGYRGKHIVHGHHQFADGPRVWKDRTDLDTFAWNTGRIVIGVFNDTQGPAVDFIEVKEDE